MGDASTREWLTQLRSMLKLPPLGEKQWLTAPPQELLDRLDRGDVEGISLPVLQQMELKASRNPDQVIEDGAELQAAMDALTKVFEKVRDEGLGLLKLCEDAELPEAERDVAVERLRVLRETVIEKYDAARALVK